MPVRGASLPDESHTAPPQPDPAAQRVPPGHSRALDAVLLRATSKEPDARFASVAEMVRADELSDNDLIILSKISRPHRYAQMYRSPWRASPPRASYSNAGRIIMGGTWPPDPSTWPPQGILDQYPQMGTSFAAPRYSFVVALYLAQAQGVDAGCGMDVLPPPASKID